MTIFLLKMFEPQTPSCVYVLRFTMVYSETPDMSVVVDTPTAPPTSSSQSTRTQVHSIYQLVTPLIN